MAVEYEVIKDKFEQLRNFIINDLTLIIQQETGGNYLAACLIACACEALSRFKYGSPHKGELFFSEMTLPSKWQPVAESLYDALRNGIVHGYDTKFIIVGSQRIEIVVSWRQHPHLTFLPGTTYLYLNIQTMAADLERALTKYKAELKTDPKLRDRFWQTMRDMSNEWDQPAQGKELGAWKELLMHEKGDRLL